MAYSMRDAYMGNVMGYENSLSHAGWKNHKYLSKVFKNGKWNYIYFGATGGKQKVLSGIDKYVTGSSYKKQMKTASEMQKVAFTPEERNTHQAIYDQSKRAYEKTLFGRGETTLNVLKTKGYTAQAKVRDFLSKVNKDLIKSTISDIRTNAKNRLLKANGWIDRNITGATAKRLANQYNEGSRRDAERGNYESSATKSNQAAALRSAYDRTLFGRAEKVGNAVSNAISERNRRKRVQADNARVQRNKSYAQAATDAARIEFQERRDNKMQSRITPMTEAERNRLDRERKRNLKIQSIQNNKKRAGGSAASRTTNKSIRTAY